MKSLEFRNMSFKRGNEKIARATKGKRVIVSRDDLKAMIKSDPSIIGVEIPAVDFVEKENDR